MTLPMITSRGLVIDIVVISLPESSQRRAQAAAQLDAAGVAWRFQDAVKGSALPSFPDAYDRNKRLQFEGYDLNPGEIGCFLSHREAWQTCVQTQRLTFILEDDFRFEQQPAEVLAGVFENQPHFDIMRLQGYFPGYKFKILKDCGKYKLVRHFRDPLGTTAYVLKPAAAKRLLEKSGRFYQAVDDFLGGYWVHRLKVLSLFPYPILPDGRPSTIHRLKRPVRLWTPKQKWVGKVRKLSRSAAKRLYPLQSFVAGIFVRTN